MRVGYQQIKEVAKEELEEILSNIKTSTNFKDAKVELGRIITTYAKINKDTGNHSVKSLKDNLRPNQLRELYKRLINFMNKYVYQDSKAPDVVYVMYLTTESGERVRIVSDRINLTHAKRNSLTIMGEQILKDYNKVIKEAEKDQRELSDHFSKFSRAIASTSVPKLSEKGKPTSFSQSNVPEAFEYEFQYRHGGSLDKFNSHNHTWFIKELSLYYQAATNSRAWYTGQDLGNLQVKGASYRPGGRITLASTDSMLTLLKRLERIFLSDNNFGNEFSKKEQDQILREFERKDGYKQVAAELDRLANNLIGEIDASGPKIVKKL